MLDVYVGNLSTRVSVVDLRDLFDGVASQNASAFRKGLMTGTLMTALLTRVPWAQSFFPGIRKTPQAGELSFTMVSDVRGRFARYCRISGYSRDVATRLITQLTGAGLHGRVLDIRPFYRRILSNDRRRAGWHFRRWLGVERRVGERRHEK